MSCSTPKCPFQNIGSYTAGPGLGKYRLVCFFQDFENATQALVWLPGAWSRNPGQHSIPRILKYRRSSFVASETVEMKRRDPCPSKPHAAGCHYRLNQTRTSRPMCKDAKSATQAGLAAIASRLMDVGEMSSIYPGAPKGKVVPPQKECSFRSRNSPFFEYLAH